MEIQNIIFVILSALTLMCALGVVLSKNPIHSGLLLVLTMFSISGHYLLLHAQFVAIVNIIVYAGAVMVLLLFVLMLLNLNKDNEPQKSIMVKIIGTLSAGGIMISLVAVSKIFLVQKSMQGRPIAEDFGYVKSLGALLFTDYILPFELASILFLAAIVGAVFLGTRSVENK
jgi:NADH-quinone oxidoreductase subunit J